MDLSTEMALQTDPSLLMEMIGFEPDPWQRTLLRSTASRILLLCSRQLGKSTGTAFVALNEAYLNPLSQVLLVSRSERQAPRAVQENIPVPQGPSSGRLGQGTDALDRA